MGDRVVAINETVVAIDFVGPGILKKTNIVLLALDCRIK